VLLPRQQSEKRNVTGHECREDLTQGKEADRVDGSLRYGQCVEQQVANPEIVQLIVKFCNQFGLHELFAPLLGIEIFFPFHFSNLRDSGVSGLPRTWHVARLCCGAPILL
jgi:hypothetical protein